MRTGAVQPPYALNWGPRDVAGAPRGQRLGCVRQQVHEDLLQPALVAVHGRKRGPGAAHHRVTPRGVRDEALCRKEHLREVDRTPGFITVAREAAQIAHDAGHPLSAVPQLDDERVEVVARVGVEGQLREALLEQFDGQGRGGCGLLISCATPAASEPSAASRWLRVSCSCITTRSVMSRTKAMFAASPS